MKNLFINFTITTALITLISPLAFAQNQRYLRLGNVVGPEEPGPFTEFIDLHSIKKSQENSYKYMTVINPGKDRTEIDANVDCNRLESIYLIEARYYNNRRFIKRDKINSWQEASDTEYSLQLKANSTVCRLAKQNPAGVKLQEHGNYYSTKTSTKPESKLPSGAYYTPGSMFINSWREILNRNGKICIKMVDGPPNNYRGREEIMISSVSNRRGKLYIDGNNQQIQIDTVSRKTPQYEFLSPSEFNSILAAFGDNTGGAAAWVLFAGNNSDSRTTPEQNKRMQECINTKGKYVRKIKGRMLQGQF
jgi:hypothetical protein